MYWISDLKDKNSANNCTSKKKVGGKLLGFNTVDYKFIQIDQTGVPQTLYDL